MKKIAVFAILLVILGFVGCSDTRILPSDTTGTLFYFQPDSEVNVFTIEFDNDTTGTLREWEPDFDYTLTVSELLALDPPVDKDDISEFSEVVVNADPFLISDLSGTRHLTGSSFSSDTGITICKVWLYTFRSYGLSNFLSTLNYKLQ